MVKKSGDDREPEAEPDPAVDLESAADPEPEKPEEVRPSRWERRRKGGQAPPDNVRTNREHGPQTARRNYSTRRRGG